MQKFEHGGDLKKIMAQENLDKIIDFSANINPYGLSKNILYETHYIYISMWYSVANAYGIVL